MNLRPSTVVIPQQCIKELSLTPLDSWANTSVEDIINTGSIVNLEFNKTRSESDPRELSEYPDIRLWSLHADAAYPWLPLILEHSTGQLVRHVAMLLPHQFSQQDGIRFGSESLELWMTHRLLLLDRWSMNYGLSARSAMIKMARALGYEIDSSFWVRIDNQSKK
ncbi:hypothetical protein PMYN1_Chma826 (chromatophore) [Paulinella micropora]|uniref:DUF1817 domain-containing protein n=1 Tax=Paulinella micropora TaxID=1928728 RepID=A0A1L5YD97_9EUKA|nr:hypothetical protein PCKR_884 [Paulinella micropora]AQX45411.1 hypothetical protein PFK_884 [Paulinella micropora]BBL86631.1 hypothetical protein PMYN1_Chma826 [Paulinella micropora]